MFNRSAPPSAPKTDTGDLPAAKPSTPFNRPASPFGPRPDAEKPDSARPAFTPPPRFGAKPGTPFGTPPSKPAAPSRPDADDDESILGRPGTGARDATDDLFEDMGRSNPVPPIKRTTNIQPILKAGDFGTSRPAPKKPLSRQDEDDDMDDLRDDLRYEDEDPRYSDDEDEASSSGDDD